MLLNKRQTTVNRSPTVARMSNSAKKTKHFTESAFSSTLNKFRERKGLKESDIIFLEYKVKPKDVKNIRDVILRYKVRCRLYKAGSQSIHVLQYFITNL